MTGADAAYLVVPGSLATPTGGYVYDRAMVAELAAAGRLAGVVNLPGTYPFPSPAATAAAATAISALPDTALVIIDGLALAPLLPVLRAHARRLRLVALVHHPLCDETGITEPCRAALFSAEKAALALCAGILTTSAATARRLGDFGVVAGRVAVVRPGAIEDRLPPRRSHRQWPPRLLSVGSLVPRKGQDELLRALVPLRRAAWTLTLLGPARDPAFARRLRLLTRALGLSGRVAMPGAVAAARMTRHYAAADLFVLPSRHEGFGIAFVEALAYGLPVVARRTAAVVEALPAGAAAWLPEAAPTPALTALLRPLVVHRPTRAAAAARARRASRRLRSWRTARREFLTALDRISRG